MIEKEVSIETADGSMRAFVTHPAGDGPFPAGIVYMCGPGYDEAMKKLTRRCADDRFYCVLADLYYRFGRDITFDYAKLADPEGEEMKRMLATVSRISDEAVVADTRAMLDFISADEAATGGPKVCVGFCVGGRVALRAMAAYADEFAAGSVLHPSAIVTEGDDSPHLEIGRVGGELYFGLGELDVRNPPWVVEAIQEQIERYDARAKVELYRGCDHAFAVEDAHTYDHEAAARALEATRSTWARNCDGRP